MAALAAARYSCPGWCSRCGSGEARRSGEDACQRPSRLQQSRRSQWQLAGGLQLPPRSNPSPLPFMLCIHLYTHLRGRPGRVRHGGVLAAQPAVVGGQQAWPAPGRAGACRKEQVHEGGSGCMRVGAWVACCCVIPVLVAERETCSSAGLATGSVPCTRYGLCPPPPPPPPHTHTPHPHPT